MTVMLTGAQKCAVLLLLLEEAEAAELLQALGPDEVRTVGAAMMSVAEIDPRAIDAVLDEFLAATRTTASLGQGGAQVRSVMVRALGESRAGSVLGRLGPPVTLPRFSALDWAEAPVIAATLAREHPQAAAVILAHLPQATAAAVLALLPMARQPDLLLRIARLGPVSGAALAELETAFEIELAAAVVAPEPAKFIGADIVAKLLTQSADQKLLLDGLSGLDAELAARIAENLFVFADLERLDNRAMQTLVREIEPETLVVALKGASEALRDQFFAAMSQRAAAQVQDDLAALGPRKRAEVDAAQFAVAAVVRRLADAGSLMLPGRADGYV
ncbi:MAG: FliG C-terminal domain-containing protein [Polymorphobacter sp.]